MVTAPLAAPPHALCYAALDRGRNRSILVAWFQLFSGPLLLCAALSAFFDGTVGLLGLLGLVGAIAFAVWYRRRARTREGAVLRIDHDLVQIVSPDGREEKACFSLRDVIGWVPATELEEAA